MLIIISLCAIINIVAINTILFSLLSDTVSILLTTLAYIIYAVGFIVGIVLGVDMAEMYSDFSFAVAFGYWFAALLAGSLLLGIAEIIKLLNIIKNKK